MRQRLEKEQIGRVIIRRNRFRVRVDHDRFIAKFLHRERCVYAAVVELNPLPNPIRPAADDDDFGFVGEADLILIFDF